jgi:hypothetical protein
MSNNPFRNRTAGDWKAVLTAFGYKAVNQHGHDEVWRRGECSQVVLVPSRESKVIIVSTAYYMLRATEKCGLTRKQIKDWWLANL